MDSDDGNHRCRWLGSPIRISPDHRLCASPRGFSQLTTSFFAFLRLGIPTHALSSLTIKSISNTEHSRPTAVASGEWRVTSAPSSAAHLRITIRLRWELVVYAHLRIQLSKIVPLPHGRGSKKTGSVGRRPGTRPDRKHFVDCSSKEKPEAWTGKAATYSVPYTG